MGGYPTVAAGTACTSTAGDGIPDAWKTARGFNLNDPSVGAQVAANGYTNLENFLNGVGDTTPPSVPTNLSGALVSSSQINLAWTASIDNVGVTGYKIFRNSALVGASATNSYGDTGLAPSTVYSYMVSAYDAAGNNSAQSASAAFITLGSSAPSIDIGSRVTKPQTSMSVKARHQAAPSSARSPLVLLGLSPEGQPPQAATPGGRSITATVSTAGALLTTSEQSRRHLHLLSEWPILYRQLHPHNRMLRWSISSPTNRRTDTKPHSS